MERRGTSSDEDDNLEDEADEEQKTSSVVEHDGIGVDERRRRQQQLQQASQRSRKRQKRDSTLCAAQLSTVRREIAELIAQLDALSQASPDGAEANRCATEMLELTQRIAFLKEKLDAHQRWLHDLRNLLAAAPLLDFALRMNDSEAEGTAERGGDVSEQDSNSSSYAVIDEWRNQASGHLYSPILIAKHVHASVHMSQDNVGRLLDEFHHPSCEFSVTFDSRGWSHAANVDDKLLTFRSSRVVPSATAMSIAAAVWRSLILDDILRTFVPLVQDVVVVYEAETPQGPVLERMVQFETMGPAEAIATIESMHVYGLDGTSCWRIAVETCDDPCLIAHASEEVSTLSSQAHLPGSPVIQGAGKNVTQHPDIVLGARCYQEAAGVCLQFAGSIRHNGAWLVQAASAVELVQFLVGMMPAYEELHLLAKK